LISPETTPTGQQDGEAWAKTLQPSPLIFTKSTYTDNMEWSKKTYNQRYEKWVPWIEDVYVCWFTKDNKTSYTAKLMPLSALFSLYPTSQSVGVAFPDEEDDECNEGDLFNESQNSGGERLSGETEHMEAGGGDGRRHRSTRAMPGGQDRSRPHGPASGKNHATTSDITNH
jgi:hypothetical protein